MFGAFSLERPELTLTECAEASGLSKSSAHRLLLSMEAVGLVERDGQRWRLGPRVVWLATVRLGQFDLRREAVSSLRELGKAFRAAAAFSVPHGSDMIYVERQESPEPFAANARLGAVARIWAGGSGRAVLAKMTPDERNARLDVDDWHRLPHETREEVLREVDAAQQRGYATDASLFFDGVAGVAVAVCDMHDHPVAALSVILPPERLRGEEKVIGARLIAAKDHLESLLGRAPSNNT